MHKTVKNPHPDTWHTTAPETVLKHVKIQRFSGGSLKTDTVVTDQTFSEIKRRYKAASSMEVPSPLYSSQGKVSQSDMSQNLYDPRSRLLCG